MIAPSRLMILAEVHSRGGVVAAAETLHLTPSAVSQQLRTLEAEARVALLDRSGRGIRLTQAGLRLARRGQVIADEVVRAGDDLAPWSTEGGRLVGVACFQSGIRQLLAPIMGGDAAGDPLREADVRLRIVELEGADAIRELHAGAVDLVIEEGSGGDVDGEPEGVDRGRGIVARLVIQDRFQIVVPEDWPVDGTPDEVRDLLKASPWVAQSLPAAGGQMLQSLQSRWAFEADVQHVFANYESAVSLVRAGAGATLAPVLALPLVEDLGGVRVLWNSPDMGGRRIGVLTRHARRPVPAVEMLLEAIEARATAVGLAVQRIREHSHT